MSTMSFVILRFLKRLAVLGVVALVLDQLVLYLVLEDGSFRGRRIAPFDPPLFTQGQRVAVERLRALGPGEQATDESRDVAFDPDLGWSPRLDGVAEYDAAGARLGPDPFPHDKPAGVRRIVAVGGSFTRGDEVQAHECWAALVHSDERFECANLGVGAYGVDQALIRFRRDGVPLEADEVWVGVMPLALARLVSVYRPALRHWDPSVSFKPRFTLDQAGDLVFHALPARSASDVARLVLDQEAFLGATAHDELVMRIPSAYAKSGTHWSHRLGVGRLALTVLEDFGHETWRIVRDPKFGVVDLARVILETLHAEVVAQGATLRVVVLPCHSDLEDWRATGGEPYWRDIRPTERAGLDWIDVAPALLDVGAIEDPSFWMPGSHLSPAGNRVVATSILSQLP